MEQRETENVKIKQYAVIDNPRYRGHYRDLNQSTVAYFAYENLL